MKKIIRLTESDLNRIVKKVINEQDTSESDCLKRLNNVISSKELYVKLGEEEDYGFEGGEIRWFIRRIDIFNSYLAKNMYVTAKESKNFDYIEIVSKDRFINNILTHTLLDFFYYTEEKEYDGEDFERDGEQEAWLYFTKDIYGHELGEFYDELKK